VIVSTFSVIVSESQFSNFQIIKFSNYIIMATFKSLTFGKISGKYGDALATQSKATGKNYLRAASVPTNPRTDKQVAHRAKFGYINSVLRPFYPVFKANFGGNQGIRYAINKAFKDAIVGEYPDYSIDLEKLIFAEGTIYTVETATAEKVAPGKVKIEWDTTNLDGNVPTALANFVFYNELSDKALTVTSDVMHSVGTATVDMPAIWNGATIHCWIYFSTDNGLRFSNSQYINSVEL
jgi:hypothetical protein